MQGTGGISLKLVLTALCWGGTWIAGRLLMHNEAALATPPMPPLAAAFFRFVLASAVLLVLVRRQYGLWPSLNRQQVWQVFGLGAIGIFAYSCFFLYGLQHIAAGRGALVVALSPALAALVAIVLFGDAVSVKKLVGIGLALLGCLMVISNGHLAALLSGEVGLGELMIIGCVLTWTIHTFLSKAAMKSLSALVLSCYTFVCGTVMLGLARLIQWCYELASFSDMSAEQVWPIYRWQDWANVAYLGLLGTAVPYVWFAQGVRQLGAAKASAYINFVPIFAVLLSAVLLGEDMHVIVLLGGLITLLGVRFSTTA